MSRLSRFLPAVLLMLLPVLVHADPPGRVGRLALVENSVNFRLDRNDPGSAASINWPISNGAVLETGRRGRSEVWVGSTAFRLGPDSQLEFPVIDDREVRVRLGGGTLAVSIFDREQSADITVETPEGRISFVTPGRYRIDVLSDHTELTALAGQAMIGDGQRNSPVAAGQKFSLYGDGQMQRESDFTYDAFDNWVAERENAALATVSRRYVSPAMTGYQDLDAYGDWSSTSEYGAVWYPRSVADDWAPYRFGRWVWVAPWGWTWVDQSPWGFAPFHYGRWVHVHNRWGWVPGSYVARPVYAPALVAWIGNPGWSVGFRSGAAPAVGWFPLAPREVYVPGFQASAQFVHRVNGGHGRNAGEIDRAIHDGPRRGYAYRAQPQAVTIIPSAHLSEGRPIRGGEFARPDRRDLERAPAAGQAPAMPPPTTRPMRDERRDNAALPRPGMDAGRPRPAIGERRLPDAAPTPWPQREENRRGNFGREPAPVSPAQPMPPAQNEHRVAPTSGPSPVPGMRDQPPVRSPEMPRPEPERRLPPAPAGAPVVRDSDPLRRAPDAVVPGAVERGRPGFRPGNDGGEERRTSPFRDNPQTPPAVRDVPRQEREQPRPIDVPHQREQPPVRPQGAERPQGAGRELPRQEMPRPFEPPRQREQPQAMPQAVPQPPPQIRAPAPPPVQAPAPVRETPRFEAPRQQPQMREQPPAMPQAVPQPPPQIRAPAPPPVQAPAPVREAPRFEAPRPQPQMQPQMQPPAPQQRGGPERRRDGEERGR